MHCLSLDDADTLPDLDEKFHGNQSTGKSPLIGLSCFTSKQFLTGDHDVTGEQNVTGGLNVSGVEYLNVSPVNSGQLNGNQLNSDQLNGGHSVKGDQIVTGEHSFELANSRLQKARKRLLLSLKKRKITGN